MEGIKAFPDAITKGRREGLCSKLQTSFCQPVCIRVCSACFNPFVAVILPKSKNKNRRSQIIAKHSPGSIQNRFMSHQYQLYLLHVARVQGWRTEFPTPATVSFSPPGNIQDHNAFGEGKKALCIITKEALSSLESGNKS